MIRIQSYESVNGLKFGANEVDARGVFGTPINKRVRPGDIVELLYDHMKLTFEQNQFCECTVGRDLEVWINDCRLSWTPRCLIQLITNEEMPLEAAGTVVLLKLGISLSGFEEGAESDRTVTAFRQNVWNADRDNLKPFKISKENT
jgi:hypothetical protein